MGKISKSDILYLFDELWPAMLYAETHKINCLDKITSIQNYFAKYELAEHNKLLSGLYSLDGIGIPIGTGLIWSAHRNLRVPFDKYTLTHSINKKLIRTNNVLNNYVIFSKQIKEHCDSNKFTIEDFVREAAEELDGSEFLMSPK